MIDTEATGSGLTLQEIISEESPLRRYYEELASNLVAHTGAGTIVVTSPDAGAGCTSVCLGLGAALAGMGYSAAVVDCNLRNPSLHRLLGEPNFIGLTSGLVGEKPLENYGHEVSPGLLALPTGPTSPSSVVVAGNRRFVECVRGMEATRDFVILDAPSVREVINSPSLSRSFDGVLLVVHASRTPKQVARESTDDLLDAEVDLLGVVLNGCT